MGVTAELLTCYKTQLEQQIAPLKAEIADKQTMLDSLEALVAKTEDSLAELAAEAEVAAAAAITRVENAVSDFFDPPAPTIEVLQVGEPAPVDPAPIVEMAPTVEPIADPEAVVDTASVPTP